MTHLIKKSLMVGLIAFSAFAVVNAADDDKPVKPDNTKVNERDRAPGAVTADQQGQNKSDVELTAKIRKAVFDDKALSHTAHNVKIITLNGAVTLRGPVKTEAEKTSVAQKAVEIAGEKNVKNEIEIAP